MECRYLGTIVAHVCTRLHTFAHVCMHWAAAAIFMQTIVHTGNAIILNSIPHAIVVVTLHYSHHQMQNEMSRPMPSYPDRERKKMS